MKSVTAVTPVAFSQLKKEEGSGILIIVLKHDLFSHRQQHHQQTLNLNRSLLVSLTFPCRSWWHVLSEQVFISLFLYFCICNCSAWLSDMAWPSLVTSDAQGSLYFSPGKIRCHYFTTSAFSSWSNTNTNTQHQKYKIAKTNTHIWCHYLTIHNSCDPGKLPNLVPKPICFALNLVFVLCTICMLVIEYLFSSFCKFCSKCQITRARCFSGHPPPPWPNFSNIHRKHIVQTWECFER